MTEILFSYFPAPEIAAKVVILGAILRVMTLVFESYYPVKNISAKEWIVFDSFLISIVLFCGATLNGFPYYRMFWLRAFITITSFFCLSCLGGITAQAVCEKKNKRR